MLTDVASSTRPVPIQAVGADLLTRQTPEVQGKVAASFDHALHIELEDDRLLTLLSHSAQRSMRTVNLDEAAWSFIWSQTPPESSVTLSAQGLFHANWHLPWHHAPVWQSPALHQFQFQTNTLPFQAAFTQAKSWVAAQPKPQHPLWQSAYTRFFAVIATLNADIQLLNHAVCGLVGLGPGLTPTGDDFLAGLNLGLLLGGETANAQRLHACIEQHVAGTTRASQDQFQQAHQGWLTQHLADVLEALGTRPGAPHLHTTLIDQCNIGSSSGRDVLIGLFAGLEATLAHNAVQNFLTPGERHARSYAFSA